MSVPELLRQLLISAGGTWAFAILFHVPRRSWWACAVTGGVGWLVYCLCVAAGASTVTASLIAVLPLTVLCRVLAIGLRMPITVFLFSGIFPLVPGAAIYYTAYYFIRGNNDLFVQKGAEAIKIAVAMALGIAFVLSIPLPRRHRKSE